MDLTETQQRLGTISDAVSRNLAANGLGHACIHGSALLTSVLQRVGFANAYPLTVRVRILNAAYQSFIETHGLPENEEAQKACADSGGAVIWIGKGIEVPADRWPGHLVVIVPNAFDDRHALLDLTIIQAHKPEWNVHLAPLVIRVRDQFVRGEAPHSIKVQGSLLMYDAYPNDHSYNDDGHWLTIPGLDQAISDVVEQVGRC